MTTKEQVKTYGKSCIGYLKLQALRLYPIFLISSNILVLDESKNWDDHVSSLVSIVDEVAGSIRSADD